MAVEYGWCKGLSGGSSSGVDYAVGSTEIQNIDLTISIGIPTPQQPAPAVTVPIRVDASRATSSTIPSGDTHIEVMIRDANGKPQSGLPYLQNEFGYMSQKADNTTGKAIFNAAKSSVYWVSSDSPSSQSNKVHIDGNNIQPQYNLTVTPNASWNVSAQLMATVKGKIGFWKAAVNKDSTGSSWSTGWRTGPTHRSPRRASSLHAGRSKRSSPLDQQPGQSVLVVGFVR